MMIRLRQPPGHFREAAGLGGRRRDMASKISDTAYSEWVMVHSGQAYTWFK